MPKLNPYNAEATVTETYNPDSSKQVNIQGPDGKRVQINQGADGNVAITKTEKMDLSKILPFTSLQPAASAMDQIFGTKMASSIPSQSAQIQNYRMLQGQERSPLDDLRKEKMLLDIENAKGAQANRAWMRSMKEKEFKNKKRLQESQASEKEARAKKIKEEKATDYAKWVDKSGIPQAVNALKEIERITSTEKDLPGVGRTGWVPRAADFMLSQKGQDLRASADNLFNVELKNRSGAAVTDQELFRLRNEFENRIGKSDTAARRALQKYANRLREVVRNIHAGTPKEGLDAYKESPYGVDYLSEMDNIGFGFGGGKVDLAGQEGPGKMTVDAKRKRLQELREKALSSGAQ